MVKFMKKRFLYKIFFIAVIFLFAGCKDPVYYNISQEEEMLEPLIKGSPTNFVEFKGSNTGYNMYVASGDTLYRYDGTNSNTGKGNWRESRPGGEIFTLATTSTYLYALCKESSGKFVIKRSTTGNSNTWSNEDYEDHVINTIYTANDQLFIGAGSQIGLYYIIHGNSNKIIVDDAGNNMLNGAAYYDGYYFLTAKDLVTENGGDIYKIAASNLSTGKAVSARTGSFVGIIDTKLGSNPIKAINRSGNVFNVTSGEISPIGGTSMGERLATGGLAVWKDKDGNLLFLAGRQDMIGKTVSSGYSYGYVEVRINTNGEISGGFTEPGLSNISTVQNGDNGRYRSTVGRYPVNHISQASDGILFASTQVNGVYSYRDRRNIGLCWNAEEE